MLADLFIFSTICIRVYSGHAQSLRQWPDDEL